MTHATAQIQATISTAERQILHRIDRGVSCPEDELRYQLDRKDQHPLARDDRLLDVLAELEERGLITSALHFRVTDRGRAELQAD